MATSWFKFNPPGVQPFPNTNPLSYTVISGTPGFVTGSSTVAFIFATTQVIGGIVRPIIPASSSLGNVTTTEINTDVLQQQSSGNCYVS